MEPSIGGGAGPGSVVVTHIEQPAHLLPIVGLAMPQSLARQAGARS